VLGKKKDLLKTSPGWGFEWEKKESTPKEVVFEGGGGAGTKGIWGQKKLKKRQKRNKRKGEFSMEKGTLEESGGSTWVGGIAKPEGGSA